MSFSYPAAIFLPALFAVSVLVTGCGRQDAGPPPHYAFLGFENLSGDSSLDWVSHGASEFLSRSLRNAVSGSGGVLSPDAVVRANQALGPRPAGAPGASAARAGAIVAGANRIVDGYVERTPSGVRITASEEDAATHKTVRTLSATATSAFDALNLLAHQFSPQAGPPPTMNMEAFRLYCAALEGPLSDAQTPLGQAVALDPSFGRAWVALARTFVATGDRSGAGRVIRQADSQKIAPIDRAWLDFEDASLTGDRGASLVALRKVSEFDSGDLSLIRSLAGAETSAGNFSQAAAVWKSLTVRTPNDTDAWNQLGYTLCWSGDYPGALAALREYARLQPNEANPLDSQGDVHYWFGKFTDADASYSAAYARVPGFLNGGELYKGAWARFRAGNKAGADALFAKFRAGREKTNDPAIDLLAGDWLYRTGREKEARALLGDLPKKEGAASPPAMRAAIAAQLAVWDLLAGDRAAAVKDITDGGGVNLTPGDVLVRFAAAPTAPASEWEARAARFFAAPQLANLRSTALGYALILDGKKQAAIPVWEQIVKESPGNDFFPRNILSRLKNQPVEHSAPPDPVNLNQFAAVPGKL